VRVRHMSFKLKKNRPLSRSESESNISNFLWLTGKNTSTSSLPLFCRHDVGKINRNASMMEVQRSFIALETLRSLPFSNDFPRSSPSRHTKDPSILEHKASRSSDCERVLYKVHKGILLCGYYTSSNRVSNPRFGAHVLSTLANALRAILVECRSKKGY
jgi:hypothetical protein